MRRQTPATIKRPAERPEQESAGVPEGAWPPEAPGPGLELPPGFGYDPRAPGRGLGPEYPHNPNEPIYDPLESRLSDYPTPGRDVITSTGAWPPAPNAPAWKPEDVHPIPPPESGAPRPIQPAPIRPQPSEQEISAEEPDQVSSSTKDHLYAANV
jgi:hypothetical protein